MGGAGERLGGKKMEEETEVDILLARKRREANDRYFQRVNQGVLDVVSKLEEVAIAMRAVEQESKELWGDDNESIPGSAKT
jgi:septum formation topological specificity factor MinE